MPLATGSGPPQTPDPSDLLAEIFSRAKNTGGPKIPAVLIFAVAALLWLGTGIYQVGASEVGVVLRFGATTHSTQPGLHWHLPWPAETVIKVPVARINKQEVGFRTIDPGPPARYRPVVAEARMLTSDGNILDLDFIVQYQIADALKYLFNVRDPVDTLRDSAESAMREVIGHTTINSALTGGRAEIQIEAQKLLQSMLNSYEAGILVTTVKLQDVAPPEPVQDAFKDVIAAEQDKERLINEAEGFANDILPKARGAAAQTLNQAQAYAQTVVKDAEGQAGRFELVLKAYQVSPDITRKRMYLETMEKILPKMSKVILDGKIAGDVLPHMNIGAGAGLKGLGEEVGK